MISYLNGFSSWISLCLFLIIICYLGEIFFLFLKIELIFLFRWTCPFLILWHREFAFLWKAIFIGIYIAFVLGFCSRQPKIFLPRESSCLRISDVLMENQCYKRRNYCFCLREMSSNAISDSNESEVPERDRIKK